MKIFITGAAGQLGNETILQLKKRGHDGIASDIVPSIQISDAIEYIQLDITDRDAVYKAIARIKPDAIIHCAAWTAVDAAEDEENRAKVDAINHVGTQNIAEAAKAVNAKMMYISTDYVFNGEGEAPWQPDDKSFAPLNYYGVTKMLGEQAVTNTLSRFFIVRIAWVFGSGQNFIKTMLQAGKIHDEVRVVNDQFSPSNPIILGRLLIRTTQCSQYDNYIRNHPRVKT